MDGSKDPAIKLFGRKITVPDSQIPARPESKNSCDDNMTEGADLSDEDNSGMADKLSATERKESRTPVEMNEESQATSGSKEVQAEKVFKKPDKILPCPRCNSVDTKFCYFNNYNVNQPRHFCKNCQRYWTAGGTMRNVPIGAGRRKNKHLAPQYRQILASSDEVPITRTERSDSSNHQLVPSVESATMLRASSSTSGNGVVLKFGPEAPLCESMETVLNLGDEKRLPEASSADARDNIEESSCGSSMTSFGTRENELPQSVGQKEINAPHSLHCYPTPPWIFSWNPNWSNATSITTDQHSTRLPPCMPNVNNTNQLPRQPTPILAVPSFCPPAIPLQLIPASCLGCMPVWAAGTRNLSVNGSNSCSSPPSSSASTPCCSGNGSPKLGKHSRDSNFTSDEQSENCVFIPKTVRIDDRNKATKSPLSATLGLKFEQNNDVFRTPETKAEGKIHVAESSHTLEANPAALSPITTFRERS